MANNMENPPYNPWHRSVRTCAVIALIFSLIVAALLFFSHYRMSVIDAGLAEHLEALKEMTLSRGGDTELLHQIREIDVQVRKNRIVHRKFSAHGAYLLLGGICVVVICLKKLYVFRKTPPCPGPVDDPSGQLVTGASMSRKSTIVAALVLIVLALYFGITGGFNFGQWRSDPLKPPTGSALAIAPYPSDMQIKRNWPRFRGPGGSGVSAYDNIPRQWDVKTGDSVRFKVPVALAGNSSPVLWEQHVFLTGADEKTRMVYCFDALSGELRWERAVQTPGLPQSVEVMDDTGFAASTPVTDGRRVYAIFANGDLAAFDFQGTRVWSRNLGTPDSMYGYATSLAMYKDLVLVQYDQGSEEDDQSRLIAFNSASGAVAWQKIRKVPNSWTTPIVVDVNGSAQIITVADPWVISYDARTGSEIWRADCMGADVAPSPIYAGGTVFLAQPWETLTAISANGTGDVTQSHILWQGLDAVPDICTPVTDGELIFMLTTPGTLTCCDVADGSTVWQKELKHSFQASPSLVGRNLYLVSEKGVVFVIEAAREFKEIARCELGESVVASPAFADGRMYVRSAESLYCIGSSK